MSSPKSIVSIPETFQNEHYYLSEGNEPTELEYVEHLDIIHALSRFGRWQETSSTFTLSHVLTTFMHRLPAELRQRILVYLISTASTPAERLTAIKSFSWSNSEGGCLPFLNLIKTSKLAADFRIVIDNRYTPWLSNQFVFYRRAMHKWSLRNLVVRYNTSETPWAPNEGPMVHIKAFLINCGEPFSSVFEDEDGWTDLGGFVLLRQAELSSSVNVFYNEWIALKEYNGKTEHRTFRRPNEIRLFQGFLIGDEEGLPWQQQEEEDEEDE